MAGNLNLNSSFGGFSAFPGRTWPRDRLERAQPEKWCRMHPKSAPETNSKAMWWPCSAAPRNPLHFVGVAGGASVPSFIGCDLVMNAGPPLRAGTAAGKRRTPHRSPSAERSWAAERQSRPRGPRPPNPRGGKGREPKTRRKPNKRRGGPATRGTISKICQSHSKQKTPGFLPGNRPRQFYTSTPLFGGSLKQEKPRIYTWVCNI